MKELLDSICMRPRTCVMEIIFNCNLRCMHCASDVSSNTSRGRPLSLGEIKEVVSDLAHLGCEQLILSGGEPLLRKDWEDICQAIVAEGIMLSLISNGMLIDAAMSKRIKDASVSLVALSIDGGKETHNRIRNHDESFERVNRAARNLVDQGIPTNFITTITTANINELRDIEDVIVDLGANRWLMQVGSPLGRLNRHPELVIAPSDLPMIADFILEAKERDRVTISVGDNIGYFSWHEPGLRSTEERGEVDFFCGCSAGCLNIGIESNGNVKGCLSLQDDRFIEGNVREEPLSEIWRKKGNFAYNRDFKLSDLDDHCSECEYGELCRGGCTFMSFGATGKLHADPYCLKAVMDGSLEDGMASRA